MSWRRSLRLSGGINSPSVHQPTSSGHSSTRQAAVSPPSSNDYDGDRMRKLQKAIDNEIEIIDLVAEDLILSVENDRLEDNFDKLFDRAISNLRWARDGVCRSYNFENVGSGNSELLLNALSSLVSLTDTSMSPCSINYTLARRCLTHQLSSCSSWKFDHIVDHQDARLRAIRNRLEKRKDGFSSLNAIWASGNQRYRSSKRKITESNARDHDIKMRAVENALYNCKKAFDIFLHHQTDKITEASTLLKDAYEVLSNPGKSSSIERDLHVKTKDGTTYRTSSGKGDLTSYHASPEKGDETTYRTSSEIGDLTISSWKGDLTTSSGKGELTSYHASSEKGDLTSYHDSSNGRRDEEPKEALKKEISALKTENAELNKRLEEKCRTIEELSLKASYTCVEECSAKCVEHRADREADFQQQKELLKNSSELQEELERCEKQLAEQDAFIKSLEQGHRDLDEKNANVQLTLETMHQKFDTLKQEKRRDEEEKFKLDEEVKRLTDQISAHQNKVKTKEERSSKLDVTLEEAMVRVSQLQEKVDKLEREKKSCEDEMAQLKDDLSKQASDYLDQTSKQQVEMEEELKREKKSYEDEIAKLNCDMTNQERNYLDQISRQRVEMDEEIKRQKKLAQQATDNSRRLQDKVEELEGILEVKESELKDLKDEFSEYKYKLLGSAITKESANYQDLNDTLRPGKVIEMHKDLRVGDCLDVIDSLESEDEEIVKRMLNSIVQESYNLVSERLETSVEALTTAYRTNVTEDTDAVHAFENDMREKMKSDWKKDIGSLLTDDIIKETLKRVDTQDLKEDLQEIDVVTDYIKSCLRFAFSLCVQTPQFQLDSSPQPFDKNRHELEVGSSETSEASIDYFIWPTLICNDKEKRVLKKGIVQLK